MSNMKSPDPLKKNGRFYVGMVLTILEGLLSATVSFTVFLLVAWILDGSMTYSKISQLTIMVLACFGVRFILYGIGYTLGQIGGAAISKQIRLFLGDKCKRIPMNLFSKGQSGTYLNIVTENVSKYERVLTHKVPNLVKNGAIILMIIVFSWTLSKKASLIMIGAVFLFIPEMIISFHIADCYGEERTKVYNKTVSSVVEYITGIQTLRSYGLTGTKNKALTDELKKFSRISFLYEAKGIPVSFFFNILQWLALPAVMIGCKDSFLTGRISDAQFLMLCMIPILLVKLLMSVAIDIFSFKDMYISKKYITELVHETEEPQNDTVFAPEQYDIHFDQVSFSYEEGKEILKEINLSIPEGSFTAIVGDSGSGKSTIMNLISKYYEPQEGKVRIGDIDISHFSSEAVLSQISLVDQEVFLFDDTVLENVRHARKEATDREIKEACRKANCEDFILNLQKGYDTEIGENGHFLSGGERQRLSIARAILRNSPIILLDEATAALDIENELKVKQAIQNLLKSHKTVVMIAHTLPVIQNADQIVVVDHQQIEEIGTHDQLIARQGKYCKMWTAL